MAFRADIVKMIEDMVTKIEEHHFKVNSNMKSDFVTFVNSFFKFHLDQTDINFTLNANILYADTSGVKVIIATDNTMTFAVPGCTIPMRDEIEAFIVIDEVVAYDSFKMRRFRKAIQDPPASTQITAPAQITASAPTTTPASRNIFTTPTTTFNVSPPAASTPASTPPVTSPFTPPSPAPSSFNFSTTPSTTPTSALSFSTTSAPVSTPTPSSFNFQTTPTTSSAFHLSTVPTAKTFSSPTNLFSTR